MEGHLPFKIGQACTGREIDWASLQLEGSFTETRLEDVDLTKTQPHASVLSIYMKRGNPSQELRVGKQQHCDTF